MDKPAECLTRERQSEYESRYAQFLLVTILYITSREVSSMLFSRCWIYAFILYYSRVILVDLLSVAFNFFFLSVFLVILSHIFLCISLSCIVFNSCCLSSMYDTRITSLLDYPFLMLALLDLRILMFFNSNILRAIIAFL